VPTAPLRNVPCADHVEDERVLLLPLFPVPKSLNAVCRASPMSTRRAREFSTPRRA
jgi:hypothetical protein